MDFNINNNNKLSFRFIPSPPLADYSGLQTLPLWVLAPEKHNSTGLNFANSNYKMMENIKSGVMELNSVVGSHMANNFIAGDYTSGREPCQHHGRSSRWWTSSGSVYTTFGYEPFMTTS